MHPRYPIVFLSLIFGLCFSSVVCANTHTKTLKNGMKVVIREDHRSEAVLVQVWYKVGSKDEWPGETGLSHMLEHMMFKGTKRFAYGQFDSLVTGVGGQLNAFTFTDFTAYYEYVSKEHLPLMLTLEADRMQKLTFDETAFKQEQQVVAEERRMRYEDVPQNTLRERLHAMAYMTGPYHYLTIGWMQDIQNYTLEKAKNWYKKWYAPNNAILVVVGDVVPTEVFSLAEKTFAANMKVAIPPRVAFRHIEPLGQKRLIVKQNVDVPQITLAYPVPSLVSEKDNNELYALALIEGLFTGGNSARFIKNLVRDKQIAASVSTEYFPFHAHDTLFKLSAIPNPGVSIELLEKNLFAEIKYLKQNLVTEQALTRIKNQVIANIIFQKDSHMSQAEEIGILEANGLGWQQADVFLKKIQEVTPIMIQQVVQKYFQDDRCSVGILLPKKV